MNAIIEIVPNIVPAVPLGGASAASVAGGGGFAAQLAEATQDLSVSPPARAAAQTVSPSNAGTLAPGTTTRGNLPAPSIPLRKTGSGATADGVPLAVTLAANPAAWVLAAQSVAVPAKGPTSSEASGAPGLTGPASAGASAGLANASDAAGRARATAFAISTSAANGDKQSESNQGQFSLSAFSIAAPPSGEGVSTALASGAVLNGVATRSMAPSTSPAPPVQPSDSASEPPAPAPRQDVATPEGGVDNDGPVPQPASPDSAAFPTASAQSLGGPSDSQSNSLQPGNAAYATGAPQVLDSQGGAVATSQVSSQIGASFSAAVVRAFSTVDAPVDSPADAPSPDTATERPMLEAPAGVGTNTPMENSVLAQPDEPGFNSALQNAAMSAISGAVRASSAQSAVPGVSSAVAGKAANGSGTASAGGEAKDVPPNNRASIPVSNPVTAWSAASAASVSVAGSETPFAIYFAGGTGTEPAAAILPKMILPSGAGATAHGVASATGTTALTGGNSVAGTQSSAAQPGKNPPAAGSEPSAGALVAANHGADPGAAGAPAVAAQAPASSAATMPTPGALPAAGAIAAPVLAQAGAQNPAADTLPTAETRAPANAANVSPQTQPAPAQTVPGPVQVAQMANRAGQAEMRIGLNTLAFGSVEVRTVVHASDVGLIIGSEKGDLRGLLTSEMPAISNSLQQQNLRLSTVSFTQGFGSPGNMGGGPGAGGQQRSFAPQPSYAAASVSSNSGSNDGGDDTAEAAPWQQFGYAGGSLSILA